MKDEKQETGDHLPVKLGKLRNLLSGNWWTV